MLQRIEIEGNFMRVNEAADGSVQIVDHPELTVKRLSSHVIEVDPIVWTKFCLSLDGEAG
jgi:hypothetical protein